MTPGAIPFQLAMGAAQYSAQGAIGKFNQELIIETHLFLKVKQNK